MTLARPLSRTMALSIGGAGAQQAAGLAMLLLAASRLPPATYGTYTLGVVFAEAVVMVLHTGLYHFVVTSRAPEQRLLPTAFWAMLGLGALGGGTLIAAAGPLAAAFDAPDLASVLVALGALQPVGACVAWASAVLTRRGRMARLFTATGAAGLGALAGGAMVLWLAPGAMALVAFRALRAALTLTLLAPILPRPALRLDGALIVEALRYGRGLWAARGLSFCATFGADIALAGLFSTAEAGLYRLAHRLAGAATDLVGLPLRALALRGLGQAARDAHPLGPPLSHHLRQLVTMTGLAAGAVLVLAPGGAALLFGPDYAPAGVAAQMLALAAIARVPQTLIEPVFAARGSTAPTLWIAAGTALVQLAVLWSFARAGVPGLAAAQAVAQTALALPLLWALGRGAGIGTVTLLHHSMPALGRISLYTMGLWLVWAALSALDLPLLPQVALGAVTVLALGAAILTLPTRHRRASPA